MKADLLNPKTWQVGTVSASTYSDSPISVRFIPGMRGKLAILDEDVNQLKKGWFLFYNRTENRWVVIEHSIFRVFRSLTYMLDGWNTRELPTVEQARQIASDLNIEFAELTQNTPESEQEKLRSTVLLGYAVLGKVRNHEKVAASEHLAALVSLRDSRGRINQSVFMCRSIQTFLLLEKRLGNVDSMAGWIHFYRECVRHMCKAMQKVIEHGIGLLNQALQRIEAGQNRAFKTVLERFETEVLDRMGVKPFVRNQRHMRTDLRFLSEEKVSPTEMVKRMRESLRFLSLRLPIEMEILRVSRLMKAVKREGFESFTAEEWNDLTKVRTRILAMVNKLEGKDPNFPLVDTTGWIKPTVVNKTLAHLREAKNLLFTAKIPNLAEVKKNFDATLQFL